MKKGVLKERDFSKIPTREENEFYQAYQALGRVGYEREWYLIENLDMYKALRDKELISKQDFRKVPTREVYAKYVHYNLLDTRYDRDLYRTENPDLDEWGVLAGKWKETMTEQKRRLSITPEERFIEELEGAKR